MYENINQMYENINILNINNHSIIQIIHYKCFKHNDFNCSLCKTVT